MENMLIYICIYIYISFEITQYTEFVDYKLSNKSVAIDFMKIKRIIPRKHV